VYHVLNRAVARHALFDDAGDYAAFEWCRPSPNVAAAVESTTSARVIFPNAGG
jgi:hypothetical protein